MTPRGSSMRKAPRFKFTNTSNDLIEIEEEEDNTSRKGNIEDEEYVDVGIFYRCC